MSTHDELTPAQYKEGIRQIRRIVTRSSGYMFAGELTPFADAFKELALAALEMADSRTALRSSSPEGGADDEIITLALQMYKARVPSAHFSDRAHDELARRAASPAPAPKWQPEIGIEAMLKGAAEDRAEADRIMHDLDLDAPAPEGPRAPFIASPLYRNEPPAPPEAGALPPNTQSIIRNVAADLDGEPPEAGAMDATPIRDRINNAHGELLTFRAKRERAARLRDHEWTDLDEMSRRQWQERFNAAVNRAGELERSAPRSETAGTRRHGMVPDVWINAQDLASIRGRNHLVQVCGKNTDPQDIPLYIAHPDIAPHPDTARLEELERALVWWDTATIPHRRVNERWLDWALRTYRSRSSDADVGTPLTEKPQ